MLCGALVWVFDDCICTGWPDSLSRSQQLHRGRSTHSNTMGSLRSRELSNTSPLTSLPCEHSTSERGGVSE